VGRRLVASLSDSKRFEPATIQAPSAGALQNVSFRSLALLSARYLFTILIETLILLVGLSKRHSIKAKTDSRRMADGLHLSNRRPRDAAHVRSHFARDLSGTSPKLSRPWPSAFCSGWLTESLRNSAKRSMWQDFATIVVANLASFIGGEILNAYGWYGCCSA
jgi:hypothetical protein